MSPSTEVKSATNRNLARDVQAGSFREDLCFPLGCSPLRHATVASARDRHGDPGGALSEAVQRRERKVTPRLHRCGSCQDPGVSGAVRPFPRGSRRAGKHGRHCVGRLLLGSVAEKIHAWLPFRSSSFGSSSALLGLADEPFQRFSAGDSRCFGRASTTVHGALRSSSSAAEPKTNRCQRDLSSGPTTRRSGCRRSASARIRVAGGPYSKWGTTGRPSARVAIWAYPSSNACERARSSSAPGYFQEFSLIASSAPGNTSTTCTRCRMQPGYAAAMRTAVAPTKLACCSTSPSAARTRENAGTAGTAEDMAASGARGIPIAGKRAPGERLVFSVHGEHRGARRAPRPFSSQETTARLMLICAPFPHCHEVPTDGQDPEDSGSH